MAFVKQAETSEGTFPKLSDVPLLRDRCKEDGFCKSGLIEIEHLIPPSRFLNFTLVNYKLNVRMNVSNRSKDSYAFLMSYSESINEDGLKAPKLMVQIRDRKNGYFDIGNDDKKTQDWQKASLGHMVVDAAPF